MSVLKSKRKPSQFEVFHHLYKMRHEITDLLLRDFGYSYEKSEKRLLRRFNGKEYRELNEGGKAARHWVVALFFIELLYLLGIFFSVVAVFFLDICEIRLEQVHLCLFLLLLYRKRQERQLRYDSKEHYRESVMVSGYHVAAEHDEAEGPTENLHYKLH